MGSTAAKLRTTTRSAPLVLPLTLEVEVEDEPALAPVRVAERLDEDDVAVPFRRIAFRCATRKSSPNNVMSAGTTRTGR